jgi:D-alanine-D-alanine ligase-like ATP-grasp enzyme
MAKGKNKTPYLTGVIKKLAPKIGARALIEPEWKIAGQIIYKNGVVRSLRMYALDLNPIASSEIAIDKDYSKFFMKQKGYPVAEGVTIFEKSWAKVVGSKRDISYTGKYAKKLGYPLIVKPNSKSQGVGVTLVHNSKELRQALVEVHKGDRVGLLEKYIPGKDYRVVVLDKDIISAYERVPLSVTGDGRSTVLALLQRKQKQFISSERDTRINFKDRRMKLKLSKYGYSFRSILPKGEKIYLLDNANLSSGGDSLDVTKRIHPGFKKTAINLTRDMGLRIAGVDIMVTKGDITKPPEGNGYYIIEINAAPGLDHYVTTGKAQKKIVEDMYLKVLKALGKKNR